MNELDKKRPGTSQMSEPPLLLLLQGEIRDTGKDAINNNAVQSSRDASRALERKGNRE